MVSMMDGMRRKSKNSDLSNIITAEHEKKWVALSKDRRRIISFDESLIALKRNVGDQDVTYMKVPSTEAYHSF
jgi:hypothetical protein